MELSINYMKTEFKDGDTVKIIFCAGPYTMKIIGVYLYDMFDFSILFNKISNIEYIRAITGDPKIYSIKKNSQVSLSSCYVKLILPTKCVLIEKKYYKINYYFDKMTNK